MLVIDIEIMCITSNNTSYIDKDINCIYTFKTY